MTSQTAAIHDRLARRAVSAGTLRPLIAWLYAVALLVVVMVLVGGATRLTESGLSIAHWSPVNGALPPLSLRDWEHEFALYRQTTEYRLEHAWMQLADFKQIFWWEWTHRFLGRVIGLAYALPFFLFLARGRVPAPAALRLWLILALGGLQGVIGWWMVASGLTGRVDVSHYRLAVHLAMALTILSLLVWAAWDFQRMGEARRAPDAAIQLRGRLLLGLVALQILLGAFVAGLNGGFAYNSWPLMGDTLAPAAVWELTPAWRNFLDNPVMLQFLHRTNAWAVVGVGLWVGLGAWRRAHGGQKQAGILLLLALALQMLLGIAVIVTGVPVWLGVAHQAGAVLLLLATLRLLHRAGGAPGL